MKNIRFMVMMLLVAATLTFTACGDDGGGGGSNVDGNTVINIAAIPGVVVPAYGGTPVTAITETAQYSGTVSWSPADATFAAGTVYTATITLTAKSGYTLTGVTANFFTVAGATGVTSAADTGVVTVVFPATGTTPATVINITAIPGVVVPAYGGTPVTAITETAQYTGTVSWSPTVSGTFAGSTVYTATITLTAKSGYSLTGVTANFFTVAGAAGVTNAADTGVVTAVFPATGAVPPTVINIAAIPGLRVPAYGGTPVTAITETAQYTGAVTWSGTPVTFAATTVYTATITLTAKSGYTLTGVTANFFTVAGATGVTNAADTGVVTAVFPATGTAGESGFTGTIMVGNQGTIAVGSVTAEMIYANNQTSITFPFSLSSATPVDDSAATLTRKFFMSKTEVTNALMAEVLNWAKSNNKISESGTDNLVSDITVKYGNQELLDLDYSTTYIKISYSTSTHTFSVASGYEDHPVVFVSWYGAIMFCNWLTEMRDGNTTNVVYTGIDTTWADTETVENADRNGYRLPSSEEWEYAARYIGPRAPAEGNLSTEYVAQNHNGGHATLTDGYYWTPADYASGAIRDYTNETDTRAVAWYSGDPGMVGGDKLMPVAQKAANQLGLYDMSGNVYEWCFTASGSYRVVRVGTWADSVVVGMQLGYWYFGDPSSGSYAGGFRFARSAQ